MYWTFIKLIFAAAACCLATTASAAGGIRTDKGETDWEVLLAPYLWGTSIKGTSQVGPLPPVDVDASFGDIFSNLNMAMSLHTEFHRGKWALVIDPTYISLEMEADSGGAVTPEAEVDIWFVEFWGSYEIVDNWEILGGGRWQQQEMKVDPGLPVPPFPGTGLGVKEDWLDWFIGARFNYPLGASRWFLTGRGDVAIAGDSESSWNLSILFNRRIRETMAVNLGYRYFENDYDNAPSYAWDVRQRGPIVGYTWSF